MNGRGVVLEMQRNLTIGVKDREHAIFILRGLATSKVRYGELAEVLMTVSIQWIREIMYRIN